MEPQTVAKRMEHLGAKASISGARQNGEVKQSAAKLLSIPPGSTQNSTKSMSPNPPLLTCTPDAQMCRRFRHTSTPPPSGDSARAPRALLPLRAIYLKHISNSIGLASGRFGNGIDFNRQRRPDFVDSCFRARISGGAANTTRHGGRLPRPTVQTRLLTRLLEEVWFPGRACQRLLASLFTSLFAREREAACGTDTHGRRHQ